MATTRKKKENKVERKYELTDNKKEVNGRILTQIRAAKKFTAGVCDFPPYHGTWHPIVRKGKLGGWIEKEENLSQEGNCWVEGNAMIFDNARVRDNAIVSGNAKVYDEANISRCAHVYDNAKIYDNASITGEAEVFGNSIICGRAIIDEYAKVMGYSTITDKVSIYGEAVINGGLYWIGSEEIENILKISGIADINTNTIIENKFDYFTFKLPWLPQDYGWDVVTWSGDMWTFCNTNPYILDDFLTEDDEGFLRCISQGDKVKEEIARKYVEMVPLMKKLSEEWRKRFPRGPIGGAKS